MENQDIFNQFKKAADHAESPNFASMEKVWHRVEEKLDQKELKKETVLWKKWAVAASILLAVSIGYQFLDNGKPTTNTNEIVTDKDTIQKGLAPKEAIVKTETVHPDIKKDADQILKTQTTWTSQLAVEENINSEGTYDITRNDKVSDEKFYFTPTVAAPAVSQGYNLDANKSDDVEEKSKDVELFMRKENGVSSVIKKQKPLVVYDNKATNTQSVKEVEMDEIESIVELKEPLYIINGIEYTEEQLFGPKPTSPYAPLDQQEIDSISVLQDEKAVEIYGEKGKKGVVIISTKNGKPAAKKAKRP